MLGRHRAADAEAPGGIGVEERKRREGAPGTDADAQSFLGRVLRLFPGVLRVTFDLLGANRIGAIPVLDGRRVEGIISERDIIYCLRDHGREVLDWPVSKLMSSPALTAETDTPVLSALGLMTQRRIRHLPVVERQPSAERR